MATQEMIDAAYDATATGGNPEKEKIKRLFQVDYPTIAEMAASATLIDGNTATVTDGHNGEPETFVIETSSTLAANGTTVVALTGIAGRAISTRTSYIDWDEMNSDARALPDNTTLSIAGGLNFKVVASGENISLAGGNKVVVTDIVAKPEHYGAPNVGVADATTHVQATLNNHTVVEMNGTYRIGAGGLSWPAGVRIIGTGNIIRNGTPTAPCLKASAAGKYKISNISFNDGGHSTQNGTIEIDHPEARVWITDCEGAAGYSSVWGKQAEQIVITRGDFYDDAHPLYFGDNDVADLPATIGRISLTDVTARDAKTGGDGVKTVSNVKKLVIKGGNFTGNAQDGIDLFAGCESADIIGANCSGNTVNGIDIKVGDGSFPEAIWGKRRRLSISGGFYNDNAETGVKIYGDAANGWFEDPSVFNAEIVGNEHFGILCRANSPRISGNLVVGNGHTIGSFAAIFFFGDPASRAKGGVCSGNVVGNNGRAGATNVGITVSGWDGLLITGNEIGNRPEREEFAGMDRGLSVEPDCVNIRVADNVFGQSNVNRISMSAGTGTLGYNEGLNLKVRGTGSIPSGGTSATITHGAAGRPAGFSQVRVWPIGALNGALSLRPGATSATTATISSESTPSGLASFSWEVDLTEEVLTFPILQ